MKIWNLWLIYLFCCCSNIDGWWDAPHMLIAQIAHDNLPPTARKEAEDLLAYLQEDFPESSTFITAACFPDDITSLGISGFKVWHGMLTPYSPDNYLSEQAKGCIEALTQDNNLISAINQSLKTLKNSAASRWEKCFLLKFLLHCVGDIHQPLHCIQLYSEQFPNGDLAGHRFTLMGLPYKNLHQLWDAAFGLGAKKMARPLNQEDALWIQETAQRITAAYPRHHLSEVDNMNLADWSCESYRLAIDAAYGGIQPNAAPSSAYLLKGEQIALRQMALAGYRLANLLREIFCEIDAVKAPQCPLEK